MSEDKQKAATTPETYMPSEAEFQRNLAARHRRGVVGQGFYYFSIGIAILALITLFTNVINEAFGTIATIETIPREELTGGRELSELSVTELADILEENVGAGMAVLIRDNLSQVPEEDFTSADLTEVMPGGQYPAGFEAATIANVRGADNSVELLGEILELNLTQSQLERLVLEKVVELQVVGSWTLLDTVFNYEPSTAELERLAVLPGEIEAIENDLGEVLESDPNVEALEAKRDLLLASTEPNQDSSEIDALRQRITDATALENEIAVLEDELAVIRGHVTVQVAEDFPEAEITRYYSWLRGDFLTTPMSSTPGNAGIRTAILGSIYMMVIVILFTLPVGVGAALYLEEYAGESLFNRVIETNVRNLAGVPSIIYGMLGLAILVRAFAPVTSGVAFGYNVTTPDDDRIAGFINAVDGIGLQVIELEEGEGGFVLAETDEAFDPESYDNLVIFNEGQEVAITLGETEVINEEQTMALINAFRFYGTPSLANTGNPATERLMRSAMDELATGSGESAGAKFDEFKATIIEFTGSETIFERLNAAEIQARLEEVVELSDDDSLTIPELDLFGLDIEQFLSLSSGLERISSFTIGGRTLISAALTLGLLILPIVIINAQEALRAVPYTIREASYGLGATQWQTIWRAVLPAAIPGILTGAILSVSRAVGETAPLIVVGASTFLLTDPNSPFSRFTVLPIQIYNWTARPQAQFGDIAAAAIIVLLLIMLSLNAIAIVLRNRFSIRY